MTPNRSSLSPVLSAHEASNGSCYEVGSFALCALVEE